MSNFAKYENLQALFTAIGKKKLSVSDTMPAAGAAYEDICILYIGPTDANYTKGYVYECKEVTPATDPKTYEWNAKINVDVDLSKYKTIFPGTKEEWETLTEAQQDQYDYCFFDGDESDYYAVSDEVAKGDMHPVTSNAVADTLENFQTALTFDNAPTEDSNNPVKSGGVYSTNQNIYEVMGQMGAKNLFYFDIDKVKAANTIGVWNGLTYTINGVAFTINDDGTVTANGTASSSAYLYLSLRGTKMFALPVGKYIETGSPSAGCQIEMTYTDSNNARQLIGTETGEGQAFEVTSAMISSYFDIGFNLYVIKDETVSNVVFYPMIRLASDTDSTYQSYAKTNKQLTEDKAEQAEVNDIVNVYGSKNLNKYPYYSTSLTTKGLTFTDLGDGRIKINGTATGTVNYVLQEQAEDSLSLEADADYLGSIEVISGSGSKGSGSQYQFRYERYHGHTSGGYKDIKFTSSYEEVSINTSNGNTNIGAYFSAYSGNTFTDLIIAPMIRKASIKDTTWQPYAKTNRQLTDDSVDWNNFSELGAVNVLENKGTTQVDATTGLTFTVNDDKSVTVSATSGTYPHTVPSAKAFIFNSDSCDNLKDGKVYRLSGCPSGGGSSSYYIAFYQSGIVDKSDQGNGYVFAKTASMTSVLTQISIKANAVLSSAITFYPMIAPVDYNGSYVPYAMTNRELTENIGDSFENGIDRIAMYDWGNTPPWMNSALSANTLDDIIAAMPTVERPSRLIIGTGVNNTNVLAVDLKTKGLHDSGATVGYLEITKITSYQNRVIVEYTYKDGSVLKKRVIYAANNSWTVAQTIL